LLTREIREPTYDQSIKNAWCERWFQALTRSPFRRIRISKLFETTGQKGTMISHIKQLPESFAGIFAALPSSLILSQPEATWNR
jgi:hypothetical protein